MVEDECSESFLSNGNKNSWMHIKCNKGLLEYWKKLNLKERTNNFLLVNLQCLQKLPGQIVLTSVLLIHNRTEWMLPNKMCAHLKKVMFNRDKNSLRKALNNQL